MKSVFHQANSRGHADHGWLNTYHTFSFAGYYNPERVHFGSLRVLNDDTVEGGEGFGMHQHDNMEIITIPIEGELEHKDNMGNAGVIQKNEIQVMSAGTGILHSEFNKNKDSEVKLFQIWVIPNKTNVTPRYQQKKFNPSDYKNKLLEVVSPNPSTENLWIYQTAWFHLGEFEQGFETEYKIKDKGNGVYAFSIRGSILIEDQILNSRDGFGIWDTDKIKIKSNSNSELLLIEVPIK